jgi:cytoskeletal protein CcmA (bactofilin family)
MAFERPNDSKKGDIPSPFSQAPASPSSSVEAFLGKGSKVVGTLTFTGPVTIDGEVEGEINSRDSLTIGETAVINAKINGSEVLIRGTVNGDIAASKRLALKKPAKVMGNLTCCVLSIEEGVSFEGRSTMEAASAAPQKSSSAPGLSRSATA